MTIFIEYTEEQKKAIANLRRAFTRCRKAGLGYFNQYGTLQFLPDTVSHIDDNYDTESINQQDVCFEEVELHVGEWSDDLHFVHFTEKGKKELLEDKW